MISQLNTMFIINRKDFNLFRKTAYKGALAQACNQLPNSKDNCSKFIDAFFDKIYAKDLQELSPEFCAEIGACTKVELIENDLYASFLLLLCNCKFMRINLNEYTFTGTTNLILNKLVDPVYLLDSSQYAFDRNVVSKLNCFLDLLFTF